MESKLLEAAKEDLAKVNETLNDVIPTIKGLRKRKSMLMRTIKNLEKE